MSFDPLHRKTLDRIYNATIEHLKSSGDFDEMRVNMIDAIQADPDYKRITDTYISECEEFCRKVNLKNSRKDLRMSLDRYPDSARLSSGMARDCTRKILKQHEIDMREKFINLVINYLKSRFMQQTPPNSLPEDIPIPPDDIALPEEEPPQLQQTEILQDQAKLDEPMQLDHGRQGELTQQEHVPLPTEPVSLNQKSEEQPMLPIEQKQQQTEPQQPEVETEVDMDLASLDSPVAPEFSPISLVAFSDVSSVHTADLSDFEDSIKLSDDEANIVGQPKNSRIKIEELQGTINGLQTKRTEPVLTQTNSTVIKQEQLDLQEPMETAESDACSESTTNSRRAARKRKINPRYSNEHFTS